MAFRGKKIKKTFQVVKENCLCNFKLMAEKFLNFLFETHKQPKKKKKKQHDEKQTM